MKFSFFRKPSIYDVATGLHAKLLADQGVAVGSVIGAFSFAHHEIDVELARLIELVSWEIKSGTDAKTAWSHQQERVEQLLAKIRGQMANAFGTAHNVTEAHQERNVAEAINGVRSLLKPHLGRAFVDLDPEVLDHVPGNMSWGAPLSDALGPLGRAVVDKATETLAIAMVDGLCPFDTAATLASQIQTLGREHAVLIAKNETMQAYRWAQIKAYRANKVSVAGWRWLSARNENCCPVCIAMDGMEHTVRELVVTHLGCSCIAVPILKVGDKSSGSGVDWFDGQDEALQREVLRTPERYNAWKTGSLALLDMVERTESEELGPGLKLKPLAEADNLSASVR